MSDEGDVSLERMGDHVARITVDRQRKKNAFTPKMLAELAAALTEVDEDPGIWAGVLTFAGPDTTAGLDMALFFGSAVSPRETEGVDPFGLRRRISKPLVTAVQGITYTVGIEIALSGDIVVASEDARFCQLEGKRGLAPLGGGTFRYVKRAGWGNAMYHLLRVDEFDAREAYRIGLVQEVMPPGAQIDRAVAIGREIAGNAPLAMVHTKRHALLAEAEGEEAAVEAIDGMARELMATADFQEGISSFLERRRALFDGR
jgi:enoyl-CoA hydratase